jgi:programmed cell death 6-interacting protein
LVTSLLCEVAIQYQRIHDRYGDEIGRLTIASDYVKEALGVSRKGLSASVVDDLKARPIPSLFRRYSSHFSFLARLLKGLQDILADNLKRAIHDNDVIYLEPITTRAHLPPISAASMVKPIIPPEVQDPIVYLHDRQGGLGRPLLDALIPYGVHLAVSVYDDRKDALIRNDLAGRAEELDSLLSR